jgi:hypothetical protein
VAWDPTRDLPSLSIQRCVTEFMVSWHGTQRHPRASYSVQKRRSCQFGHLDSGEYIWCILAGLQWWWDVTSSRWVSECMVRIAESTSGGRVGDRMHGYDPDLARLQRCVLGLISKASTLCAGAHGGNCRRRTPATQATS